MIKNRKKIVALVGRPNVGKSTLFNRLVGRRIAIETDVPGTTRDTLFGECRWRGNKFELVDLAGIEFGSKKEIDKSVQEGIEIALKSADLIIFLVDWNDQENEYDKVIAKKLRSTKKKVVLAINKVDNPERMNDIDKFSRLGNFTIVPVSAISGKNTGDFLDVVVKELKKIKSEKKEEEKNRKVDISLAIIGRPNTGKSTLLNQIIGEKRAIVSEIAGTTRDVINVEFFHKGEKILLADTAGLRRPGKIDHSSIESYSVLRAERAIKESSVTVLMIDATEGLVALDANILGKAKEQGKGIVLAVNKIDKIEKSPEEFRARLLTILQRRLNFVPWLPVVFISAQNGENVKNLLDQVVVVWKNRQTVIDQSDLDAILNDAKDCNSQLAGVKEIKQKKSSPPIFEITVPKKRKPHYTQVRYIENKIRDQFPMNGSPIFVDLKLI